MKRAKAEIVATGDELTLGRIANTNAAWLSRKLSAMGFEVARHTTLPDVFEPVVREYRASFARADLVVLSGGLGPTVDDLTRAAAARAARVPVVRSARALAMIRAFFGKRGRELPEGNEVQADLPRGAEIVPNPVGTAPGFVLRAARALVVALPGVPPELEAMWEETVEARLRRAFRGLPAGAMKELHMLGLPESEVNRRLAGIASPDGNPRLSLMVSDAVVTARFVATGRTPAAAKRVLAAPVARARRLFRAWIYGEDGASPAEAVLALLAKRKLSLALAESCTGGLIGHLLTEVPGMSAHLREGWVTYSNEAKVRRLGVPAATIRKFGAVSAETAAAMAEGTARTARAAAALAVTGIAGPGGGTREKPVGLVWIAVRVGGETTVKELRLGGTRSMIKQRAARLAIGQLISRLR